MTSKNNRRCSECHCKNSCDIWKEKSEKTISGWDKNRFAISCGDYKEEKEDE